jgi:hypothetical protein
VHPLLGDEAGDDGLGIRPAGNDLRADKRGSLDVMQPGLGERLDQLDLVGRADRAGFDLEALTRALLVNLDMFREGRPSLPALSLRPSRRQ